MMTVGRKAGALVLYALSPVVQVFVPRATPFFLTLAVAMVKIAEIAGRNRETLSHIAARYRTSGITAIAFCLFLAVMTLSLLWSPMPWRGAKDIVVLFSAFLATGYLAHHLSQLAPNSFAAFVSGALVVGSVGLLVES